MAYSKTNWVNGNTSITAEKLNKIEEGIADAHEVVTFECSVLNSSYVSILSQHCQYIPHLGMCFARLRCSFSGYNLAANEEFGLALVPSAYAPAILHSCNIVSADRHCRGFVESATSEKARHIRFMVDKAVSSDTKIYLNITAWWFV